MQYPSIIPWLLNIHAYYSHVVLGTKVQPQNIPSKLTEIVRTVPNERDLSQLILNVKGQLCTYHLHLHLPLFVVCTTILPNHLHLPLLSQSPHLSPSQPLLSPQFPYLDAPPFSPPAHPSSQQHNLRRAKGPITKEGCKNNFLVTP